MKKIISLLLVSISFTLHGQTKEETQQWIKEKIELYSYSDDIEIFNKYIVQFSEGNLIITNYMDNHIGGINTKFTWTYWIPIKELAMIRFEENQYNVWMYLKIKNGKKSIKSKVDFENQFEYYDKVEIYLEKDMMNDNLTNRMTKAFNHLIKLYGGASSNEKF